MAMLDHQRVCKHFSQWDHLCHRERWIQIKLADCGMVHDFHCGMDDVTTILHTRVLTMAQMAQMATNGHITPVLMVGTS